MWLLPKKTEEGRYVGPSNFVIDGWYTFDPHACASIDRGFMWATIDLAFHQKDSSGRRGIVRYSATGKHPGVVETSQRRFCVLPGEPFTLEGSQEEVQNCPAGYEAVPFSIHINPLANTSEFTIKIPSDSDAAIVPYGMKSSMSPPAALSGSLTGVKEGVPAAVMEAYNKGDNEGVVAQLREFLQRNPENGEGYFLRGLASYKLNRYELAIADFSKSLVLDPKNKSRAATRFARAMTCTQSSQYREALADIDIAIDAGLNEAGTGIDTQTIYSHRSVNLFNLHQYDEAVRSALKALRADPQNLLAQTILCLARVELKLWQDAKSACASWDRANPGDAHVKSALAEAFEGLGDRRQAIELYERAVALEPNEYYKKRLSELRGK